MMGARETMSGSAPGHDQNMESLDDLLIGGLKYIQARSGYRFSVDSILLAHFPLLTGLSRAVDLGAGNGLLAMLLAWRQPGLRVAAVEMQESMAGRARRNLALNRMEEQVAVVQADVCDIRQQFAPGSFELAICNPPFFIAGSGHQSWDPEERLARHESSATLADFISAAHYLLARRGRLALVMPARRLQEALHLCQQNRLTLARLRTVHSRPGENAVLALLEVSKGSQAAGQILPPLYIYTADDSYSGEILAMYGGTD